MTESRLVVAELGKAHGLRGEILARVYGLSPEELRDLPNVVLRDPEGQETPARIASIRPHGPGIAIAIEGIADRTAAERMRGAELLARREDLPELGEREWYLADLVGCEVVEEDGAPLGTLEEVLQLPAHDVYVIRGTRGEVLVPATQEFIVGVDTDARRMIVHLIPGLVPGDEQDPAPGE